MRQALESSLMRLRDMLGQQGLQLAQADVGHRQPQAQGTPTTGPAHAGDAPGERDARTLPARTILRSRGLLDEYA